MNNHYCINYRCNFTENIRNILMQDTKYKKNLDRNITPLLLYFYIYKLLLT